MDNQSSSGYSFNSVAKKLKHARTLRLIASQSDDDDDAIHPKKNSKFEVIKSQRFKDLIKKRNEAVTSMDIRGSNGEKEPDDRSMSVVETIPCPDPSGNKLPKPFLSFSGDADRTGQKTKYQNLFKRAISNEKQNQESTKKELDRVPSLPPIKQSFKDAIKRAIAKDKNEDDSEEKEEIPKGWAALRKSKSMLKTAMPTIDHHANESDEDNLSSVSKRYVRNLYAPRLRLHRGFTCRDIVTQLFEIWEPQCSESYRPTVKFIPPPPVDLPKKMKVSDLALNLLQLNKNSNHDGNDFKVTEKGKCPNKLKTMELALNVANKFQTAVSAKKAIR